MAVEVKGHVSEGQIYISYFKYYNWSTGWIFSKLGGKVENCVSQAPGVKVTGRMSKVKLCKNILDLILRGRCLNMKLYKYDRDDIFFNIGWKLCLVDHQ